MKAGDWYQHPETENVGPLAMQADGDCLDHMTRHILRKLPAPPKPEDQVPPATTTAEGGAVDAPIYGDGYVITPPSKPEDRAWKPGDRAWVEVEVVNGVPDGDGEVRVKTPRCDGVFNPTAYTLASALRETPGGGE